MRMQLLCCAALALAGAAAAQTDNEGQSVMVRPSPIHGAPPTDDDAPSDAPPGFQAPAPQPPPPAIDAEASPPPMAAPEASAPEPSSHVPQVAIARRVVDAAGAFDGYVHRTAAIDPKFADGAAVARAVEVASVYEPRQLEEGAIAYAALIALQDPMFVSVVQELGENPRTRDEFAAKLVDHPETVLGARAARRAATRVSTVLGQMGLKLITAGVAVKQGAYDLQAQAWSREPIAAPGERLARIKAESTVSVSLNPSDTKTLIGGITALRAGEDSEAQEAQAVSPVVTQGLALAALAVLGKAGDDQGERINSLLTEAKNAHCLQLAKLNAFECLAVAGPHYENAFCLGTHGMVEPGKCIASAAGMSDADLAPLGDNRSVFVPVATVAAADGPERASVLGGGSTAAPGVMVPTAGQPQPANYSPYAGPMQP
jgi:hypothetical protein